MAIFYAQMKPLCRRDGRSAVAATAYRAGVRLVDERTGLVHDYSRRSGVEHAEMFAPDGGPADRSEVWNAAEAAEKRKDGRTGREWVLALPAELDAEQRRELARSYALEIVSRYGVAVDMAIHAPGKEGDERNHHAHIFATTRQVSRDESGALALGGKASLELSDAQRRAAGRGPAAEEVTALRQLWERLANEALERAGRAERIDSRSLEAQGVEREPTTHLGPSATAMERRGEPSRLGDHNRQVEARNAEREAVQAEIIDLQAERNRRAKEAQEEAARQEAAAERARDLERWEAMSFMERKREMKRLRPPALESLIEQDAAMTAAQSRQQEAEERQSSAAQEAEAWRERHGLRTWLHDRKLVRSSELEALENRREEAQRAAEASARSLETTRTETTDRLTEAQRPAQERFSAFMEVEGRKTQEAALAARREALARKEAEEQARAAQAREEAQKAAREDAEREATRQERLREETRVEERRRIAVEKGGAAFRTEVRRDPEAMRAHLLKTYLPHKMTHRERETWAERMQEVERGGKEPEAPKTASPPPSVKVEREPSKPPERPAPKPPKRDRSMDRDRD